MAIRNVALKTKSPDAPSRGGAVGGIELYLKRIFALMFGAVAVTALASYITMATPLWTMLLTQTGLSALYYILLFGGLALAIWAQVRAFSFKPSTGGLMLFLYAILTGIVMTPLLLVAITSNPYTILSAFVIAAEIFPCMALFGYKTGKDLSFLCLFLFMGMIGLLLVGLAAVTGRAHLGGRFRTRG